MDDSLDLIDAAFPDGIDPGFGHWLAGFTDGEGCFFIARVTTRRGKAEGSSVRTWPNCRFQIGLRIDDVETLTTIRDTLGIGSVYYKRVTDYATIARPNAQASAQYVVHRIDDCMRLVELFTRYPLRAKKRAQFDVWAEAVHEMAKGYDRDDDLIEVYRARLAELRKFIMPTDLDQVSVGNPTTLKHRRDYGTPPACLCGCGGVTKILSNPKGGIQHPENPNYSCFMRGHYSRRTLARYMADF